MKISELDRNVQIDIWRYREAYGIKHNVEVSDEEIILAIEYFMKSKRGKRGFLGVIYVLLHMLITLFTGGIWLLFLLIRYLRNNS